MVSQGLKGGFKSSLRGTAGILTGNATYFVLSALGLGALLMSSATLFQIIKSMGAAYLVFIGLTILFSKKTAGGVDKEAAKPNVRSDFFRKALSLRCQTIVFFSALLPQFVSAGAAVFEQFCNPGDHFACDRALVLMSYGGAAERGSRLVLKGRFSSLVDSVAGGFLIGAGLGLAATKRL